MAHNAWKSIPDAAVETVQILYILKPAFPEYFFLYSAGGIFAMFLNHFEKWDW
jgi:hypothetical protein